MLTIRTIAVDDAPAYLALCRQLDTETKFMMLEPGERTTTVDEQRARIAGLLSHSNQTILLADRGGSLAGYLAALGGEYLRNRHSAHVVIGILQAFVGQGVGTQLFAALEIWARAHAIHRLELTVMAHNERGLALYKKMGFEVEGTKRHSLLVDGAYVDEHYMARLLS